MSNNISSTTYFPEYSNSSANTMQYAINQALLNVNTILPCQIIAITGNNTFTIQSLVNTIDATGQPFIPPIIYNVPATIIGGGNAGIIIEYQVNDTVLVGFCQRDITSVKPTTNNPTWTQQNPGSFDKFALSDAIIIAQLINTAPTIYVKITPNGIDINASNMPVTVEANSLTANITNSANINAASMTATITNTATINATTADITANNVNLGNPATGGVLVSGTTFMATVTGLQPSAATIVPGVEFQITSGGSSTVQASV